MIRLFVICTFLWIGTTTPSYSADIGSDEFACYFLAWSELCEDYEEDREQYLNDYTAHMQAIPDGMAVCLFNCDYPFLSGATGFYRTGNTLNFGDITFLGSDYISTLPDSLKLAVDWTGYPLEEKLYETLTNLLAGANGGTVYVRNLGGFSLQSDSVFFTASMLQDTASIGSVGSVRSAGTAAASIANYTYISTTPATTSGLLKSISLTTSFISASSINQLKILAKDAGSNFTVKNSIPIAITLVGTRTFTLPANTTIQAGQYIGLFTSLTKLTETSSTTNPRRYRITGNPSLNSTKAGTLQNYSIHLEANIYRVPPQKIPGVDILDTWTWEGTGYVSLQWHTGNICYKKGCYDYDFSLRFKQVGEFVYGRPIYCQLGHRNTNIWLAGQLRGGVKVRIDNGIIDDYIGQNLEIPYSFSHSPTYWE